MELAAGRRVGRARGRCERRTGIGARLVAGLVLDLAALAVALRDLADPVGPLLVAILLLELSADRPGDLCLGRRLGVSEELDHEPAVLLGADRLEESALLRVREHRGVE